MKADAIGHASRRRLTALLIALALLAALFSAACGQTDSALEPLYPGGGESAGSERAGGPYQPLVAAAQAERTLERLLATEKPERDLFDLGRRYKGLAGNVARVVNAERPDYALESVDTFWLADDENDTYYQISAVLRGKSEHLYMYVQEGLDVRQADIEKTLRVFEENIYPTIRRYFGSEWSPGVDNDPRITVLNARIPGFGGYYSSADQFPSAVNPFSNEREMFYINVGARGHSLGADYYLSTLCHEFQHMVHWNQNAPQETWLNEGAAVVASRLCGYGVGALADWFAENPDVQLTSWSDDPSAAYPHYAAAYLFMEYLAQHYGGHEKLKTLIALPLRGQASVDAYLAQEGYAATFYDVFADWTAANYIDDRRVADGAYAYDVRLPDVRPQHVVRKQTFDSDLTVKQFGTQYVDLRVPHGDYTLEFAGAPQVRLFTTTAPSGTHVWWSNRSDMADTSLTGAFDLRNAAAPVLRFRTWYDIEPDFDYAYVAVSTDGGETWATLPGATTTTENPNGNNLGHGFTGASGGGERPQWIEEEIDLGAYAGKQILLRLEYVTDDAVNGVGFLVDDLAISGIGFSDDAETDGRWEARGFFRTDGVLPQYFIVQLVRYSDGLPTVERAMLIGQDGVGVSFSLSGYGDEVQRAALMVSGATPVTTEAARFHVRLAPVASGDGE